MTIGSACIRDVSLRQEGHHRHTNCYERGKEYPHSTVQWSDGELWRKERGLMGHLELRTHSSGVTRLGEGTETGQSYSDLLHYLRSNAQEMRVLCQRREG